MIILFWFVLSIGVGIVASSKGRLGIGWFFCAFLFSPLIAILLLLVCGDLKKENTDAVMLKELREAAILEELRKFNKHKGASE